MSIPKAYIRCMGGKLCNHAPDTCTADPGYQAEIAAARLKDHAMTNPDQAETLEAAIELLEARLQHPPTMFYTRPIALAAATRTVIAALNMPTITPAEPTSIDAIARIVDPDPWHDKLTEDGLGVYWMDRRIKARGKAKAILASLRSTPPAAGEGQAEAYITEEWCLRMAELEGDAEVGAGFESVTPLIAPAAGEEVTEADHELAEAIYSYGKGRPVKLGKGHSTAEWIARHRLASLRSTPPAAGEGDAETYLRRVLDANSGAHVTVPEALLRNVLDRLATRSADVERYRAALEFYADPETYHACSFWFDRPTGGFDEDFDEDHGHEDYDRPMPGKRARSALTGQPVTEGEGT